MAKREQNSFFGIWLKKGTKKLEASFIILSRAFVEKKEQKLFGWDFGMIEKEQRPGAYFIISSIRNIIGQEGTFMDEKGTTLIINYYFNNTHK